MDARRIGDVGLHGWRKHFSNFVAEKAPIRTEVARAALAAFFFTASAIYVAQSVRAFAREMRR